LYGSKFHKLSSTRGQQGIGISAAVLYGQLTTGKPANILSKTGKGQPGLRLKLKINTQTNNPDIIEETEQEWEGKEHGVRIEIDMEGEYMKGRQSVDEYLKETAIVNPHATIIYTNPEAQQIIFPRATENLPPETVEIKPHPYGVELGILMKMLENTECRTLQQFLCEEFVRVGPGTAKEICANAALLPNMKPKEISRDLAENLYKGIQKTKIIAPPTDCISPIGEELLEKGLRKEINAEFYCAVTRPPEVYRGNPFIIECCTGDSKIILEDGTILPIKEYVESTDSRRVMSMNQDLKIVPTTILAKQKFENVHKLLRIKTRTGRELTLTANNEVPVICNGEIIWKKTEEVACSEYLAVPRQLLTSASVPLILDLLPKDFVQILNRDLLAELLSELSLKYGDLKSASRELNIPYDRLKAFKRRICTTRPNLTELEIILAAIEKTLEDVKEEIKEIRYVDNAFYNPQKISIPEINEDLLYILGLLYSDGYIKKNVIAFVNLEESLHQNFKQRVESLFQIKVQRHNHNSHFCNKTIYHILVKLQEKLSTLPTPLVLSWLKGVADGDGWVNQAKKVIGIATAAKEKADLVQTLLLRAGILSTIQKRKIPEGQGIFEGRIIKTKKEQYNIVITGYSNVLKFRDFISFRQAKRLQRISEINFSYEQRDSGDVVPVGDLLRQFRGENILFQNELNFSDTSVRQIEKGRQNITRNNLQQLMYQDYFSGESQMQLLKLAHSDVFCDKIIDIQLMPHEDLVYDLTTENGNFIANNIIMHNCGIAYGGEQDAEGAVRILRFANRVPLLYQQGACAIINAITNTAWKSYGLNQSNGSLPTGPCTMVVHMSSVWVPFTSESKEALAHYNEIIKEIKLALQECGRKLAMFVNKKRRIGDENKKRGYIEKYIPHVADALKEIVKLTDVQKKEIEDNLAQILEHVRGELEEIGIDNPDYDAEFAKIGQEEEVADVEEPEPVKGRKKTVQKSADDDDDSNTDDDDEDNDSNKDDDVQEKQKKQTKQTRLI
ncbi:MAG TPA: DNA topoisomerase VI subunit B, partial [Candidatus Nanoarchaeia archaeon]|nr:DNA topoisomerase VI subunit B [Candidatus Nanoarchaeia archaeon]